MSGKDRADVVQQTLFQTLFQTWNDLPDAIIATDGPGAVVFANAAAAALCGLVTADEMTGIPLATLMGRFELFDTERRSLTAAEVPWMQAGSGRPASQLMRFWRAGAPQELYLEVHARPSLGPHGEVCGAITTFRDMTEREMAARRARFLAEASAILSVAQDTAVMLQAMADHAVQWLADLCLVDLRDPGGGVSRAATARRHPATPPVAARAGDSPAVDPGANTGPGVAEVFARGAPVVHPNLIFIPLSVRGDTIGVMTFAQGDGSLAFTADDVAVATDLARRASLSVDNARLYALSQEGVRSRDDLLAIVSHDLRNPLGVVLTSAALLLRAALPPDKEERARRQVEAIQRAGNRMNRLIRDLLDLASIQAGQLVLTTHTHDAGTLVADSVESMQALAVQKSQRLVADVPAGPLTVTCDRERIIQVFANVIGNAIKFSPVGAMIRVSMAPDNGGVAFTVSDDGPGMTPDELRNLYDRTWQAKRKSRDGIGLGLSIVKGIVEGHGGRVWAESTVGTGTTVHFSIPSDAPAGPSASPN